MIEMWGIADLGIILPSSAFVVIFYNLTAIFDQQRETQYVSF
jgi:hypothetical protein